MNSLAKQLHEDPGYCAAYKLDNKELQCIREVIEQQWLSRINECYPSLTENFRELGIDRYHEASHHVNHNKLWQKRYRVFSISDAKKIQGLKFFKKISNDLNASGISDVVFEDGKVQKGYGEVYWRLVRPGVDTDVGPLHADKWFHDVIGGHEGMFPEGATTVKMWIPIICEPEKNGLMLVPQSHKKKWNVKYVHDGTAPKPHFDDHLEGYEKCLVPTNPGSILLFNENLLHCGAVNYGAYTRVSIEITFIT